MESKGGRIMNILSLFDGMSCGQIALKQLGITPDKYYASEIDKFAIGQTQLNFPNTIQLGSVVDVDVSKLDRIDLLIGGSPCQSFSFAGKRAGMSTKSNEEIYTLSRYLELKKEGFEFEGQSYLFWEYMRILNDIRKYNPDVKFLLENVEMGNKWERVLSEAIGVFGVHINSALVSAQNRKRIYWTNIRTKEVGLFGEIHADIPQPEDKGILLRDILESEVDKRYYLSDKIINTLSTRSKEYKFNVLPFDGDKKSGCLRKDIAKMGTTDTYIRVDKQGTPKVNHSDMDLICVAARGRESACLTPKRTEYGKQIRKAYEAGDIAEQRKNIQQLEPRLDGETNTLTSVQKDNLVMQINPSLESGGKQPYQHNRVYNTDGISPCLSTDARSPTIVVGCDYRSDEGLRYRANSKSGTLQARARNDESCGQLASVDSRIRRLTPVECARLQTVPDWYEWGCSDTQQYKMLGNGWTVDVIAHILSFLNKIES